MCSLTHVEGERKNATRIDTPITQRQNMAFGVNSSNLTIMGMQCYFQYFVSNIFTVVSCETVNATSSGKLIVTDV